MMHEMRLHNEPFCLIKSGSKTIEIRLNDEKRQLIKIGDTIEFENRVNKEKISVRVVALHKFNNFIELYEAFDKIPLGYGAEDVAVPSDMELYYSKEEQNKYGVLGIEIVLI